MTQREFLENKLRYIKDIRSGNATWEQLAEFRAEHTGVKWHKDTVRKGSLFLEEFVEAGWIKAPQSSEVGYRKISLRGDGSQVSEDRFIISNVEDLKDEKFLLKLHNYDSSRWQVIRSDSSVQQTGGKTLYSSKISVKPILSVSDDYVEDLLNRNMINPHHSKIEPYAFRETGKMLEVNIADTHIGKLCWGGETGESYDYKIAVKRFKDMLQFILKKASGEKYEKIIFVWSNDFFHYDTKAITTTVGTPQDTDLRWQKMFNVGVDLLVWAIDVLAKEAPVETFYTASNHDEQTGYYATNYLYAWYNNNPNVSVNRGAIGRKFIEYGNVMLCYCHGATEGKNINNIMSKEEPEMFGRTKFRYVHAGHFHSKQGRDIIEENGCLVRYLGSPSGTDAWHYGKGYISAIKCGYGFVYDKVYGQELEITSNHLDVNMVK